jgi:hypothetical protein
MSSTHTGSNPATGDISDNQGNINVSTVHNAVRGPVPVGEEKDDNMRRLLQQVMRMDEEMSSMRRHNEQLTERLERMQQQEVQRQRHGVIANSRASILIHASPGEPSSSPLQPPALPLGQSTSAFTRRLTVAEQLSSPYTPARPVGMEAPQVYPTQDSRGGNSTATYTEDREGLEQLARKTERPVRFSGDTSKDKTDVRTWVEGVNSYLNIFLRQGSEKGRLSHVVAMTEGAAQRWLLTKKDETDRLYAAGRLDQPAEWVDIQPLFLEYFEGPQYRMMLRAEMETLRLGKGKCKDITTFNSEFDRLRVRLYTASNQLGDMDIVCGDEYGKAVLRSDATLWADVYKLGIPVTLEEWKTKTATAWAARQAVAAVMGGGRAGYGSGSGRPSYYSGQQQQQHTARANRMQTNERGTEEEGETWPREEGQPEAGAAAQAVAVQPSRRNKHLKHEPMQTLKKMGACFLCYQKGHMISSCPCPTNKLPQRAPTAEELKA